MNCRRICAGLRPRRFRRWHRVGLVCLLAAVVSGCAGLGGIRERPSVTLAEVHLREWARTEQRFALTLRVRNPNDTEIPVSGLDYELEVQEMKFARGSSEQAVTIPARGEALMEVSAVSNLRGLVRKLGELGKEGRQAVPYRLHGQLHAGRLGVSVPFDRKGEVVLSDLFRAGGAMQPGQ